jgi:hypothetical protein
MPKRKPPFTPPERPGPTIWLGTGPVSEGGDGYPNGMPILEAILAAQRGHLQRVAAAKRLAESGCTHPEQVAGDVEA